MGSLTERRMWVTKCGLIIGVGAVLAGCGDSGDLAITNESAFDVTVQTGGDTVEVSAGGGVVILDSGCTDGDVTVEYPSGEEVLLAGPVCPEQEIVVRNDEVTLHPEVTE